MQQPNGEYLDDDRQRRLEDDVLQRAASPFTVVLEKRLHVRVALSDFAPLQSCGTREPHPLPPILVPTLPKIRAVVSHWERCRCLSHRH
jgi:hypothetical protein